MFDNQPAEKSFENAVHEDTTPTDAGKDSVNAASTDDQIPHTGSNAMITDVESAELARSRAPSSESRGFSVTKQLIDLRDWICIPRTVN